MTAQSMEQPDDRLVRQSPAEPAESAAASADTSATASGDGLTEWSTPRRLHPLSIVVHLTKLLPKLLPIAIIALVGGRSLDPNNGISTGISAIVLGGGGFLVWLRTKFSISGTELRIDSGVLARQSRTASFDRIQAIDVNQQLVARLLGLAELRVQVAGGKEGHFLLACLPQAEAARLRALLLGRVGADPTAVDALGRGFPADRQATDPSSTASIPAQIPAPGTDSAYTYDGGVPFGFQPDEWPMVVVPNGRFIGAQFLSLSVWFAALVTLADVVGIALTGPGAAGSLVPVLLVAGGYLVDRFQRYFGATLSISADGLRLRHGLVNRFAQTIPRGRVQAYQIREPLLWRIFGLAQIRLNVAGYSGRADAGRGGSGEKHASVLLPVLPREEALALLGFLVGSDLRALAGTLAPAPKRAFWRVGPWRRAYGFGFDENVLVARFGLIHRDHAIVPHGKVQSMHLVQGPWQRALGLSTVHLHSTRGPVRIVLKQRDAAEAQRFLAEQAERSATHRGGRREAAPRD